jgi:autotransporter-associated beta strand protein
MNVTASLSSERIGMSAHCHNQTNTMHVTSSRKRTFNLLPSLFASGGRSAFRKFLLCAASVLALQSASAVVTLPFYDGFSYSEGTALGAVGSGSETVWDKGNSVGATSPYVTSGAALNFAGLPAATGLGVLLDYPGTSAKERGVDTATYTMTGVGETLYFSFLLNVQSYPSSNCPVAYFDDNASASASIQGVGLLPDGKLTLHRNAAITAPGGTTTSALNLNTTYFIVFRYLSVSGSGNDQLALWINPVLGQLSETTPDLTVATGGSDRAALDGFFFKQDSAFSAILQVDELRLGTTWVDVTPSSGACVTVGITTDPSNTSVAAGATANFTVVATGTSPTYQWQVSTDSGANWAPVATGTGGNTANYTTAATTVSENGYQYRCVVNVACDASVATSAAATLTVTCNTAGISSEPSNLAVEAAQTANFSLTTTGTSPTYQWEVSTDSGANWAPVSTGTGGTSASYTTAATTTGQSGYQYRCVVSVACDSSSVTSAVATLTVSCNTAGISLEPSSLGVEAGQTANFSLTATGSSPTYQWQVSPDSGANWAPVSIGTGGTTASYTTAPTIISENGYQYRCIVSVACDSSSVTSAVATLSVACTTAGISSQPASLSVFGGQTANFTVTTTGSSPTYQWQVSTDSGANWAPVATGTGSTTASYTTAATSAAQNGNQFRCVVNVACDASVATSTAATLTVADPTTTSFRSATSGNWEDASTWELSTDNGASWIPAWGTPTGINSTNILVTSGATVTVNASRTVDDVLVAAGGKLTIAASSKLTISDSAAGLDLRIFGTVEYVSSSGSGFALAANATAVVGAGGLLIHNGSSNGWTDFGTGSTLTFAAGGKFQLQKTGGRLPLAVWNLGSICEVAYSVDGGKPDTAYVGQDFADFTVSCPAQFSGWDMAGRLTNVLGSLTVNMGASFAGTEFKLFSGSANSGNLNIGGDFNVNSGRFNIGSSGGPWTITLMSNLTVVAGASLDVSGSASQSYTMILNGTGLQNYTCNGDNTATKLSWTVNSGSILNLNSDLPLSNGGRTLTANGIVNLNGKTVTADLVAGNGTIRNQGGGSGLLAVGAGNGNNTLDGTLALLNGTSGSLGLVKRGSGTLTITVAQTFSGGLIVSNGTVFVENLTGSGTGSGAVAVYGGTLGGNGIISGAVSVESGATLSPGDSVGKLTINNTLTLAGDTLIEVDKANGTNDVVVATTVNYGGTLTVTDVSGGLVAGDSFTIIAAGSHTGNFSALVGSPGVGLDWQFNPVTGVLSVIQVGVNPPTLLHSQAGNTLMLSWVEAGYKLQAQTNNLTTGINSNWGDYPTGGASPVVVDLDVANGAVFFRLAPQ